MVLQKTSTKSYISQKHTKQKSLGFYIHEEIGANIRRPLYQSLGLTQNPWVTTFMKKSEVTSEETYIRDCSRKHHHWKANASKCK